MARKASSQGKKFFTDAMLHSIYIFGGEPKASDLSESIEPIHMTVVETIEEEEEEDMY